MAYPYDTHLAYVGYYVSLTHRHNKTTQINTQI